MLFQHHILFYILECFCSISPFRGHEIMLMDEIIWRYPSLSFKCIYRAYQSSQCAILCWSWRMCLHLPGDHTQSSRSPFHPFFLFSPWGLVLWDFWLQLKSLTEESHQLELAQEKQTAQLEALPRSNRKFHPTSLLAIWRLTWGLSHGKIPTLWERNLACFCAEILQHFSLSPSLSMDYECSTGQYTPKLSVWSWGIKPEHNLL